MVQLEIEDEASAMRLRCPNGHTSIGPTNHHWWCPSCARYGDEDPEYDHAIDAVTGEKLAREDVKVDYSVPGCNPA